MFPIHDDTPRLNGRPYVNYGLIGINIVIFIYEVIITANFSNRVAVITLYSNYGSIPDMLLSGQNLGSLFSSMFMHGSIAHLLGNMFFLYVFGDNLEDRFGHFKYLMLYLFWGVMAAFAHSIYAVTTGEGSIPAIGASGAISGVLGAYLIFFPRAKIHTIIFAFFITTVRIPALAYIPFWFIMQLAFALIGQSGGVAYLAHIGGFIIGLGTALGWKFFSNMFFEQKQYPSQNYRRRSSISSPSFSNNSLNKNDHSESTNTDNLEKSIIPEIIIGEKFIDVIIEDRNTLSDSQIQANFDGSTNILYVHIIDTNKNYDISVPHPANTNLRVSDISVRNGIIRIRLDVT
ncbi:rhomboid family intramembrane serine protease [Candidatus Nitrosocosmicus arcticus]|uniref:Putative rhomboid family protein n=1 Tax=Candidatus Nitrosocosmicus arcticus TaxID=2035267 RepID=A0A557SXW4_9ARCH|nr:rhomboid family intramembrane serine protease [Candidatus Nitrosocosmicus arcticus]TVP41450.1 putative rhomboid family protein [Candidatus Nitrosocosmicus arcticus]